MQIVTKRNCLYCHNAFSPDYRNADKQVYCKKPECRKASKMAAQRRWTEKNPDHFKGDINVNRVRDWRKANPGRSRHKSPFDVLQDHCPQIPTINQQVADILPQIPPDSQVQPPVLQDHWLLQSPIIIGIFAHLTGLVLQDDISRSLRLMQQLGQDIKDLAPTKGGNHDSQIPDLSRPHPQHSRAVQLGGSTPGS